MDLRAMKAMWTEIKFKLNSDVKVWKALLIGSILLTILAIAQ